MDIITCVGKVQETEFVRSRSEPGRNCKNNKKFAKNPLYMEGFVCYTTEVASYAHLLRVQKYTRSEIPADGALRCEAGSPGKRTGRKKLTKKGEQT